MTDWLTRRLPFSEPLPGMCSSMVQVPMTMGFAFCTVQLLPCGPWPISVDHDLRLKADHSTRLARWIVIQREQFVIY
jgi:hypothetical protein